MAFTVTTIRSQLKTRLATISGLRAHNTWPGQINCPCALVKPTQNDYDAAFGGVTGEMTFEIPFLALPVAQLGLEKGQEILDEYLSREGTKSVYLALYGDVTLGGNADWVKLLRWRDYGALTVGEIDYVGCVFDVEVGG